MSIQKFVVAGNRDWRLIEGEGVSLNAASADIELREVDLIRLLEQVTGKKVLTIQIPRRQHCAFDAPNISAETAYEKPAKVTNKNAFTSWRSHSAGEHIEGKL